MAERSPTTKMPSPSTQDGGREGFVVISVCNPFRPRAQCLSMGRFQSSTCSKAVSVNGLGASGKPFRGLEQQKYNSHVLAIRYDLGTTDRSCNLILGYHVHQTGNTCRCALRDMISRSVVRPTNLRSVAMPTRKLCHLLPRVSRRLEPSVLAGASINFRNKIQFLAGQSKRICNYRLHSTHCPAAELHTTAAPMERHSVLTLRHRSY
jgi:hypothetical protein